VSQYLVYVNQSEAGKLGFIASRKTAERQRVARIAAYAESPTLCLTCQQSLSYEKRHNKFCSHSCSAIFHNPKKISKILSTTCRFCLKPLDRVRTLRNNHFCSSECFAAERSTTNRDEMIVCGFDKNPAGTNAKRYLIELHGHTCMICKGTEWYGHPMPLTLDHIDGNSEDNSLTNLRIICPNCDRFTPFFGSKNRGNGRANRRQRYRDGKSY